MTKTSQAALLTIVAVLAGCATARHLDPKLAWAGRNRQALDAVIDAHAQGSPGYDAAHPPFAAFDWDNTSIKNDAGDATTFWMIKHDKILQPPGKNWRLTSPLLTDAAIHALDAACASLAEPGLPLPTSGAAACATVIVTLYLDGTTASGEPAFASFNHRRIEPRVAWAAQIQAGHTPDEIRAFARAAMAEGLAAPVGATQQVGNKKGLAGYLRFPAQIRDLLGTLSARGIVPWIVSASPQYVVEAFAACYGIPPEHVIGIRPTVEGGRITSNLKGCGDVPDGTNDGQGHFCGNAIIPFIDGKRCFVNEVILGESGAEAMQQAAPARRQILAAGDSDTDVTFVRDATAAHLVIDRHQAELMCHALANTDGKWLVNPIFFEPLDPAKRPYPCSTSACRDEQGRAEPCRDDRGGVLADQ